LCFKVGWALICCAFEGDLFSKRAFGEN